MMRILRRWRVTQAVIIVRTMSSTKFKNIDLNRPTSNSPRPQTSRRTKKIYSLQRVRPRTKLTGSTFFIRWTKRKTRGSRNRMKT